MCPLPHRTLPHCVPRLAARHVVRPDPVYQPAALLLPCLEPLWLLRPTYQLAAPALVGSNTLAGWLAGWMAAGGREAVSGGGQQDGPGGGAGPAQPGRVRAGGQPGVAGGAHAVSALRGGGVYRLQSGGRGRLVCFEVGRGAVTNCCLLGLVLGAMVGTVGSLEDIL